MPGPGHGCGHKSISKFVHIDNINQCLLLLDTYGALHLAVSY